MIGQNLGYFFRRTNWQCQSVGFEPDSVAIRFKNSSFTYRQMNRRINCLANALHDRGVSKGDRVALLLYNCAEYFEIAYAAFKIGAIAVPLNFRLVAKELRFALNDSGANTLFFGKEFQQKLGQIIKDIPVKTFVCLEGEPPEYALDYNKITQNQSSDEPKDWFSVLPEDPAIIMYTSGTTGFPKAAIHTHSSLLWYALLNAYHWTFTKDTVSLLATPLYHAGAFLQFHLATLAVGGQLLIMESTNFDIRQMVNLIDEHGVTTCFFFPVVLQQLIKIASGLPEHSLLSVKFCPIGGEKFPDRLLVEFHERFPWIEPMQGHGLTEGPPTIWHTPPEKALDKLNSVGWPWMMNEVRIIDDNGKDVPPGEVGEAVVRSPAVSIGYWKQPAATNEVYKDGWFHTGDLAVIDKDGCAFIRGRKKDMIRSGGENIFPAELENVLSSYSKVSEVSVIGVPDAVWGESVMAIVVPKSGESPTKEEIIVYCKKNVASYKKPKFVEFVTDLPRTSTGKVDKAALRKTYSNEA